jgi:hypothetical protein
MRVFEVFGQDSLFLGLVRRISVFVTNPVGIYPWFFQLPDYIIFYGPWIKHYCFPGFRPNDYWRVFKGKTP